LGWLRDDASAKVYHERPLRAGYSCFMSEPRFFVQRLAIIGVGLIGGSLARALRQANAVGEVVGCGRDERHLKRAQELGVIDRWSTRPAEAVTGADMVVLAAPVGAMQNLFKAIQPALSPTTIVTDVGSTKISVIAAVREVFGVLPLRFVPGHPIAGTERTGVEASFAELFRERRVILTPASETDPTATARVKAMWQLTGAQVSEMSAEHHDQVLAATSHLPHVLAYALVDHLAAMDDRTEIFAYAAGGFRDFTRIASSSPEMWRDIACANREALTTVLDGYLQDLLQLREAIARNDGEAILTVFRRAKQARDRLIDLAGPISQTGA
jgi:prephenate dehydrogenase